MDEPVGGSELDEREVLRDLVNWMDHTRPDWRSGEVGEIRDLLDRACRYFEGVCRRLGIPEPDFRAPLQRAAATVRRRPDAP